MLNSNPDLLNDPIVIRFATGDDADALRLLAELNTASAPIDPVVIAESGGRPLAALSLAGGDAVADPFLPTAAVVDLLQLRAEQMSRPADVPAAWALVRGPARAGRAIRHAPDRLRRVLHRPRVAVEGLHRGE